MRQLVSYVLVCLIMCSCNKDDDNQPIEEVEPEQIMPSIILDDDFYLDGVLEGVINAPFIGSLNVEVKAVTPDGFKSIEISKVVDGVESKYETIDSDSPSFTPNSNEYTYDLAYVFKEQDVGIDLSFKAVVTDVNDNQSTIYFGKTIVKPALGYYEGVVLEGNIPYDADNLDMKHFLLLATDIVKSKSQNEISADPSLESQIALILTGNLETGGYLASPSGLLDDSIISDLEVLSTTKIKELGTDTVNFSDFNIYSTYDIEDLYEDTSFGVNEQRTGTPLVINNVYIIRLDDGKIGLFKITETEFLNGALQIRVNLYLSK